MRPRIIKKDDDNESYTDERCFIIEALNSPDEDIMSIAQARVEPGITTAWHYLDNTDERYLIIAGKGKMEVGKEAPEVVGSGDVVLIPAGTLQRITNIGNDDLIFFCICTPGFRHEYYHNKEK
ncbi:MAG: cupin domain-containing protein [candidate division Zixibacteria bacterium]